ncbi:hypothetical protein RBH26_15260 [Natronolimnohabitans sp. A-GB9]|uniref:hypothetical protein n=1 Tax=Natronolimnohabitans sp. A-GB9 TaxID=3069757 RepID=UPI0027B7CDDE|nr:hypothetical protein [Natronolimnohabitans sp. A-GB9]MDQ2051836.1 hypothetical protein [Natronolimnohabitans sp. A-GB9]
MAEHTSPWSATLLVGLVLGSVSILLPALVVAFGMPITGGDYVEIGLPDAAFPWMYYWIATVGLVLGAVAVLSGGLWRLSE